ncbi:MAG TPA: hypothetical protein VFA09_24255 [Ktedonobacteraceae bacterium]|nr:hypothetical protein [Ktedonobacteraceae bacterium]
MARKFIMQPERIAYFEAAGWKAYYDRKWFKMLWLLVRLCQEQFHIPFPMSLLAAYYTTRASLAWVPVEHDEKKVLRYLEKFYGVAHRYSGLDYDVKKVANLELKYFEVHRRLSGKPEKEELIQTLVELHSALFGLTAEQVRESAEWRTLAADTVDLITSRTSTNIEQDWRKLEEYLQKAYGSIAQGLDKREKPAS